MDKTPENLENADSSNDVTRGSMAAFMFYEKEMYHGVQAEHPLGGSWELKRILTRSVNHIIFLKQRKSHKKIHFICTIIHIFHENHIPK